MNLKSVTGEAEAKLTEGATINGNISVKTTTGRVAFYWQNLNITKDILVNLGTVTGEVTLNLTQNTYLARSVILRAETTTGEIDSSYFSRRHWGKNYLKYYGGWNNRC